MQHRHHARIGADAVEVRRETREGGQIQLQSFRPAQRRVHIDIGDAQLAREEVLPGERFFNDAVQPQNRFAPFGRQRLLRRLAIDKTRRAEDEAELAVQVGVGKYQRRG